MPVEDIKQTDDAEEKQELNESELEAVDGGAYTFYIPINTTPTLVLT